LLKKGADIDVKNNDGWTALHNAAKGWHKAIVHLLLEKGADVDAKNNDGLTALYWTTEGKHKELCSYCSALQNRRRYRDVRPISFPLRLSSAGRGTKGWLCSGRESIGSVGIGACICRLVSVCSRPALA